MSFLQQRASPADAWGFVNVEPNPMASPVKVALHTPVDEASLVAGLLEPGANAFVNLLAVRAVFHLRDGFFLRVLHGLIEPLEFGAGHPTYDGPRHIGEVARRGGARKHVEDDAAVSRQWPTAFVVWVAGLLARGDDGMLGDTVALHQRDVDHFLDALRCQRLAVQPEFVLLYGRAMQRGMRRGHSLLCRALSRFDVSNFLCGLYHTPFIERVLLCLYLVAEFLKPAGMAERKIPRHQYFGNPRFVQHGMDHIHRPRAAFRLRLPFDLRIGEYAIDGRLALRPIHFEIAHHQNPLPFYLQIDKGVRRNKLRRVI